MNVVDASTLEQANTISVNSNMLIWNQNTGAMNRMNVGTLIDAAKDTGRINGISARVDSNATMIDAIRYDIDRIDNQIADLNIKDGGSTNKGNLTIKTQGSTVTYNGSQNVSVDLTGIGGGGGGGGSVGIVLNRVKFVDNLSGVTGDINQDLTDIIQGAINDLFNLGGGTLIFGTRIYRVRTLTLKSRVKLVGQGKSRTILKKISGNTTNHCLIFIPIATGFSDVVGMTITGEVAVDSTYRDSGTPTFMLSSDVENAYGIYIEPHPNGVTSYPGYDYYDKGYIDAANNDPCCYKNVLIEDVFATGFGKSGFYVGEMNYSVFIRNCIAYANREHGFEMVGSDDYVETVHAEKNGRCGIYCKCGGTKFSNIKSIWNGYIGVAEKYTNNESSSLFGTPAFGNVHKNWGIMANAARCSFSDVEVQDNYCGGILISGRDVTFNGLQIDQNGYHSIGRGADAQLGYYNLCQIVNTNFLYAQMRIYSYKGNYNGNEAIAINYMRQSILDVLMHIKSAKTVRMPENNGSTIVVSQIRGMIVDDTYNP